MATQELTCPYCEETFTYNGYTAQRELSTHKARCPKKRYLGGELEILTAEDARKLLEMSDDE